jgi:adenylate cyclase, class 2
LYLCEVSINEFGETMEIEVRAFIQDVPIFKENLKKIGATFIEETHIIDYWFCDKNASRFEEVQQHEPGSYSLRVRKWMSKSKKRVELNCKVLEKEGDHNAFHEHETEVKNVEETKNILKSVGFKIFCIVDKKREIFKLGNCTINIENIKGFRPAVELEIISDSNQEVHKKYQHELLETLGIHQKDKIEKSITYLYMLKNSFKEK